MNKTYPGGLVAFAELKKLGNLVITTPKMRRSSLKTQHVIIRNFIAVICLLTTVHSIIAGISFANKPIGNNTIAPSISFFLDADGRLEVPEGFSGSLDLTGYSLTLDECEGITALPLPAPPIIGWSALGSGLVNLCNEIVIDGGGNIYAGGSFTQAGGISANHIAKWDGTSWSALGSGLNESCYALAIDGSGNLYAGGTFTTAGGVPASRIAKWDGTNWSALGSGITGDNFDVCSTIAIDSDDNVYAGGRFFMAGGVPASRIAKWDGTNWSALGAGLVAPGLNIYCWDIVIDGADNLYAGGNFLTAGGISANRMAKWDGSTWSALGTGLNETCYKLAIDGSGNLFAGGIFTTAGGVPASRIAKWDGTNWSALGTGLNNNCYGLASDGTSNIYACGDFTEAGGISANRIAKWDGTSWSALGTGINNVCFAVASDGTGNVYVGGGFTQAGGKTVKDIAKWGTILCDIEITGVNSSEESCPSASDGTITITATCMTCTGIQYSINGSDGPFQLDDGQFDNLPPDTYQIYIKDAAEDTCNDTYPTSVTIGTTPDVTVPRALCQNITVILDDTGSAVIDSNAVNNGSSDNCGIDRFELSQFTFSCVDVINSPITVTQTVYDASDKSSTCTAAVTLGPDSDGDDICDQEDTDDDNDGIEDENDPFPLNPNLCGDADGDGCDDCSVGTDGIGPLADNNPDNDGTDTDADGICDLGDSCINFPGQIGDACDDGNEFTVGDVINENCECIGPISIPTLSQWSILFLCLTMMIIGVVVVKFSLPGHLKEFFFK